MHKTKKGRLDDREGKNGKSRGMCWNYEHQSTYSPNMPLRCLIYFVDQIKDMLKKRDLFSRRRIQIPTPHFVVFYNGSVERPEEEMNPCYQEDLKKKSKTL